MCRMCRILKPPKSAHTAIRGGSSPVGVRMRTCRCTSGCARGASAGRVSTVTGEEGTQSHHTQRSQTDGDGLGVCLRQTSGEG